MGLKQQRHDEFIKTFIERIIRGASRCFKDKNRSKKNKKKLKHVHSMLFFTSEEQRNVHRV